jgi:hypothetical protein
MINFFLQQFLLQKIQEKFPTGKIRFSYENKNVYIKTSDLDEKINAYDGIISSKNSSIRKLDTTLFTDSINAYDADQGTKEFIVVSHC